MSELVPLAAPTYATPVAANRDVGKPGLLKMLKLRQLYVDPSYQRPVMEDGRRNIRRIAENFRWAFFSALKVSPRDGKNAWGEPIFTITDGQHHAMAALVRGDIETVPCLIDEVPYETQALAFATINGGVTKMSPLMLHRARQAAGDGEANRLETVCARAGVKILGYPKQDCAVGETMAVNTLRSCMERFGDEILVAALSLITKTGDGNPTYLREGLIAGGCDVFYQNPKWKGSAALAAMGADTVRNLYAAALTQKAQAHKGSVRQYYATGLSAFLREALGDGGQPPAAPVKSRMTSERTGRRFNGKPKRDPALLTHLSADHPAIRGNRTLFPSTVVAASASPRLLISGANSVKLGARVTKGDWVGFAIYQLSLEERATCPPTCNNRLTCYGNAMHLARRHRPDAGLVNGLRAELGALQREHPNGFVVRLHVLGDFFELAYVRAWAQFLTEFPALHVFGYTAWPRDSVIGAELARMADKGWARFALRFSSDAPEPQGATTIWRNPEAATVPEGTVCPAQTDATACCASCGLCWAAGSRDKTIVFIGHGGVGYKGKPAKEKASSKAQRDAQESLRRTREAFALSQAKGKKKPAASTADEKALIAAAVAAGKVRRLDPGASGVTSNMVDWLRSTCGIDTYETRVWKKRAWRVGRKTVDLAGLYRVVNEERARRNMQPLTVAA